MQENWLFEPLLLQNRAGLRPEDRAASPHVVELERPAAAELGAQTLLNRLRNWAFQVVVVRSAGVHRSLYCMLVAIEDTVIAFFASEQVRSELASLQLKPCRDSSHSHSWDS
jgi:hypothetical protein